MPVYINPDFDRLASRHTAVFSKSSRDSFFALPVWYDLMALYGVPPATEVRVYTDVRPASVMVPLARTTAQDRGRILASLTNAHSLEHGILHVPGANLEMGLEVILSEILAERPQWDCLTLAELDPRDPSYASLLAAVRRAGMLVECHFSSGTWYEGTAGLGFAEYLAARPSELRNTWRRKHRKLAKGRRLTKSFFEDDNGIDQAVAEYETVYAASWKPAEFLPGFVPALIRLAGRLRALRLGIYYLDGTPVAAQFWIVWNGRAVICKLAHDKRLEDLSLGTVLTMEMFERVLATDRPREISFGRGDDPYKKLWLSRRRERWGITAANPRTLRGLQLGFTRQAAMLYHRLRGDRVSPLD